MSMPSYQAIVLAGGAASRFGSDKLAARVEGIPLLDRVLEAVATAQRVVVVGPRRRTARPVIWTCEVPAGAGPAAGIAAGMQHVDAPWVVLLAGDLPFVGGGTVDRLLGAVANGCGAVLVDGHGRRQLLSAAVSSAALRRRLATRPSWRDAAVHELLGALRLREVATSGSEADDVDVPADLPRHHLPAPGAGVPGGVR